MLDLAAVKRQIDEMAHLQKEAEGRFLNRVELACREIARWGNTEPTEEQWKRWHPADEISGFSVGGEGWAALNDKVGRSRTSWLLAGSSGPFDGTYPRPQRPAQVTVIASDGSQIFPDRHEVAACYLINIGSIVIHYGTGERPDMTSRPLLFHREQDLYSSWGGRRTLMNSEILALKRGALECLELAIQAEKARAGRRTAVAFSDGTLIMWMLEGSPTDFKMQALDPFLRAFDRLRRAGVPVAGYISSPGSADVVNALRVGLCPLEAADCDRCPWKTSSPLPLSPPDRETGGQEDRAKDRPAGGIEGQRDSSPSPRLPVPPSGRWGEEGLPCEPIAGVTDAMLFARLLEKDERSAVFRSASKVLEEYGEHRVHFFYVNVGAEIARVEIPQWVAQDEGLLNLVHACVCDQAEKGKGYPVVLSEAHEKAVVRSADRELFYRFLRDTLVRHDIAAQRSTKVMKKRGPMV